MATQEVSKLELYGFTDPASGRAKLKKQRARQAIIMIGVDYLVRVFVLYAWAGRLPTSQYRDKIIDTYGKYNPRIFGIEDNAMQVLFGDLVIDAARERFGHCRIVGVPTPTKIEKDFKIRTTLEPYQNNGQLFILPDAVELRSEYAGFPTNILKDLIDCLAMAIMLVPRRTPQQERSTEIDAYAAYLRDSGAPSAYIVDQIEEMRLKILSDSQQETLQ